jgi:hypothetical protein
MKLCGVVCSILMLMGCGDDDSSAPMDAASRLDVGPSICTAGSDACDDGMFCNGVELCDPTSSMANEMGCVPGETRCLATQTCDEATDSCVTDCGGEAGPDADGDGVDSIDCGGTDCDDSRDSVFPGAVEVCDPMDVDEDCDASTFGIRDADMDDEPDALCCNPDSSGGEPHCGTDCDDSRAGVSPVAVETCNERDDDCDTFSDEGVLETFYPDDDGDGFGAVGGTSLEACVEPEGYATTNTDCDDTVTGVNPGVAEQCDPEMVDENCDSIINPEDLCTCTNGEAQPCSLPGACSAGTEICADGRWGACSIAPVTETCNRIDDNCDGTTDERLTVVCYADGDNDGYAAMGAASSDECPDPSRVVVGGCPNFTTDRAPAGASIDCDDSDRTRHPTRAELCNGLDDNCDGSVDEMLRIACYTDGDNDTYAPAGASSLFCPVGDRPAVGGCPLGRTNRMPAAGTTDCNDTNSAVRPDATEVCSASMMVDDDCDTRVDEGVAATCFADTDGDTYAPAGAASSSQCRDPSRPTLGFCPIAYTNRMPTAAVNDCAPTNPAIHPGAMETCSLPAVDENCDGMANPPATCMCGDGMVRACTLPGVCAAGTEQCMSGAWGACSIAPMTEICDGRDEDCDGTVDDGLTVTCYADGDNDTYAPAGTSASQRCPVAGRPAVGGCPVSFTNRAPAAGAIDCNDASAAINPGATEICSDSGAPADEDCDGLQDEMLRVTCYADGDSDTYAPTTSASVSRCRDGSRPAVGFCPAAYTNRAPGAGATDCNDGSATFNPGASESCDRVDHNCSSGGGAATDEDFDEDGHAAVGAACTGGFPRDDCRDDVVTTYPGATESCDRVDSNCSVGGGAETSEDFDGDGHSPAAASCTGGFPKDDCRDNNASVFPGQSAWFTTPYCNDGSAPILCSAPNTWWCDVCPPVCSECAPPVAVSWDYDCSGGPFLQPPHSCMAGAGCLGGGSCRPGPIAGGTTCGQVITTFNCTCSFPGFTCGSVTSTASGRQGCH